MLLGKIPIVILALYAGVSVLTFLVYVFDKSAAKREVSRIPENALHVASGLLVKLKKAASEEAIREANRALEIEPDYARAYMVLAWTHATRTWSGWTDNPEKELALGREAALKSVDCDKDDFWGYGALAFAELFARNHERALNAIDQAVALNPNSADSHAMRGLILNFAGDPTQALAEMELAIRLNPNHPHWYLIGVGRANFLLGRFEDAIPYLERVLNVAEDILTWRALLIASYMASGRDDQAQTETEALLQARPNVRCSDILSIVPLRDEVATAQYLELLKAAGIPE